MVERNAIIWGISLLFLFVICYPKQSQLVTVFILGVCLTLLIQLIVFYKQFLHRYISKENFQSNSLEVSPRNFEFNIPFQVAQNKILSHSTTRKSLDRSFTLDFSEENSPKRSFSVLASDILKFDLKEVEETCLCTTQHFQVLSTANQKTFQDLLANFRQISVCQKEYSIILIKLAETPLKDIIQIKKFDDPFRELKKVFKGIGESHGQYSEFIQKDLLVSISSLNKSVSRQHQNLTANFKQIYQPFAEQIKYLQKQHQKLLTFQQAHKKATLEFQQAKTSLQNYQKLMKKQMQVKLTLNQLATMKNTYQQNKARLKIESEKYLQGVKILIKEQEQFNQVKGAQYRSFVQTWLATFERQLKTDKEIFQDIIQNSLPTARQSFGRSEITNKIVGFIKNHIPDQEQTSKFKTFFKKALRTNDFLKQNRKQLRVKIKNLELYTNNLKEFIKRASSGFSLYSQKYKLILQNWQDINHLGLSEKWSHVSSSFYYFTDILDNFTQNMNQPLLEIDQLNSVLQKITYILQESELTQEIVQEASETINQYTQERRERIIDIKDSMLDILGGTLLSSMKTISKAIPLICQVSEVFIESQFNIKAKTHRPECPLYSFDTDFQLSLADSHMQRTPLGEPESANWLNLLLVTFFEQWTESSKFQAYICRRLKKIYNKNNPNYIGEINVLKVEMGTQAPQLKNFTGLQTENFYEFSNEFDVNFIGEIKITLQFQLLWNLAVQANVPVHAKVVLKSLFGRLQVFYTPSSKGESWYSFMSQPAVKIGIQPVIGKSNKISLSQYPQLNTFLVSILSKKIRKYVWPNKRSIKIPKGRRLDERSQILNMGSKMCSKKKKASDIPNEKAVKSSQELKFQTQNFVYYKKSPIQKEYSLEKRIGSGAFGVVWIANHKATNQQRAVKVIKKSTIQKELNRAYQYFAQVDVLRQTDHPGIVKMYEFFQDDNNFYIVTEYMKGGELFDYIVNQKVLTEQTAAYFIKQILGAVNYCHHNGIIHRDLKPENLLLDKNNSDALLKVIDFGTSTLYQGEQVFDQKYGTPYYIAPEVLQKNYTYKCDIWSCGVILYVLLSGNPPFNGRNDRQILARVQRGKYTFQGEVWKSVSDQAKDLVQQMLNTNPEQRPTAAQALQHPWISHNSSGKISTATILSAFNNLKVFQAGQKLQQAILAFITRQLVTKDETRKLTEHFQALDSNGDGKLSTEELLGGYRKILGEQAAVQEVERIMKEVDQDANGYIEYSEFVTASLKREILLSKQNLDQTFRMFDTDGNGTISADELKLMLGNQIGASSQVWSGLIQQVDQNGDGEIDIKEFKEMMLRLF